MAGRGFRESRGLPRSTDHYANGAHWLLKQLNEQHCVSTEQGFPFDLQKQKSPTHCPEQHSAAFAIEQGVLPGRQQTFSTRPSKMGPHARQSQHAFPSGSHSWPSLMHFFFFFFLRFFLASTPVTARSEADSPPAARPNRRRVQTSNCDPSMGEPPCSESESSEVRWLERQVRERPHRSRDHTVFTPEWNPEGRANRVADCLHRRLALVHRAALPGAALVA